MNRKQLEVMLTLLFLMCVMFTGESIFSSNIKKVALTNNNIGELNNYSVLGGTINYCLPDSWDVEEKKYPGNYIVYDNSFISEDMGILGYVQIINSSKTIDEVIVFDKDKIDNSKVKDYKVDDEKIDGEIIKKVEYKETNSLGKTYINIIYYKKIEDDKVLKVLFSSSKDKFKENYSTIFKVILDSFEHNK